MQLEFLNNRPIRFLLTLLFLGASILAIFPPQSIAFRWLSNHAEWVAVVTLLCGMVFLMLNQRRLMFVALGCSAGVCLYLSETTGSKLSYSKAKDLPFVRVAHFNVTNSEGDVVGFLESVVGQNADVVSVQEVTFEWDSLLNATLGPHYPYKICIPRFDPFGIALFSRFPFVQQDTFLHGDIASLAVELLPENAEDTVRIVATIIEPPLSSSSYDRIKGHLEKISFEINRKHLPTICLGEFNTTGWSPEIQAFRTASRLSDSRMGMKVPQNGQFPLLSVPLDHIFFSPELECIHFSPIGNAQSDYLGIKGTYQIKDDRVFQ